VSTSGHYLRPLIIDSQLTLFGSPCSARRTLVIKFENDSIDESDEVKGSIQEGKTLLRMRRPMIDMDLRYEVMRGSHITPLTQNIFLDTPFDRVDPLLGVRTRARSNFLKTVNSVGILITEWLEEGLAKTPISPPQ
jgi:hypothetical protein